MQLREVSCPAENAAVTAHLLCFSSTALQLQAHEPLQDTTCVALQLWWRCSTPIPSCRHSKLYHTCTVCRIQYAGAADAGWTPKTSDAAN